MKILTKKNIIIKIAIILVIVILFNFSNPTVSYGLDLLGSAASAIGGTLLEPFVQLMVTLGDSAMNLVHRLVVRSR